MQSPLNYILSQANAYFSDQIRSFDQTQVARSVMNGVAITYIFQKCRAGKQEEVKWWVILGFFLAMIERRAQMNEPIHVLTWDPDHALNSNNPFFVFWFPLAVIINSLYARVRGSHNHVLTIVLSIRAGTALLRLARGDAGLPRAIGQR